MGSQITFSCKMCSLLSTSSKFHRQNNYHRGGTKYRSGNYHRSINYHNFKFYPSSEVSQIPFSCKMFSLLSTSSKYHRQNNYHRGGTNYRRDNYHRSINYHNFKFYPSSE